MCDDNAVSRFNQFSASEIMLLVLGLDALRETPYCLRALAQDKNAFELIDALELEIAQEEDYREQEAQYREERAEYFTNYVEY